MLSIEKLPDLVLSLPTVDYHVQQFCLFLFIRFLLQLFQLSLGLGEFVLELGYFGLLGL